MIAFARNHVQEFADLIRKAERVEYHATEFAPPENFIWAIDAEECHRPLLQPIFGDYWRNAVHESERGLVRVICRPEHLQMTRDLVRQLRAEQEMAKAMLLFDLLFNQPDPAAGIDLPGHSPVNGFTAPNQRFT